MSLPARRARRIGGARRHALRSARHSHSTSEAPSGVARPKDPEQELAAKASPRSSAQRVRCGSVSRRAAQAAGVTKSAGAAGDDCIGRKALCQLVHQYKTERRKPAGNAAMRVAGRRRVAQSEIPHVARGAQCTTRACSISKQAGSVTTPAGRPRTQHHRKRRSACCSLRNRRCRRWFLIGVGLDDVGRCRRRFALGWPDIRRHLGWFFGPR